jgi:hypothetical protein
MSDSYQAIYDAVRSRISGGNISDAVESACRSAFDSAGRLMSCVAQDFSFAAQEQQRPCVLFRPSISIDGNQYCALYGEDLQNGVAGFGDSPEKAMADFDKQWYAVLPKGASS